MSDDFDRTHDALGRPVAPTKATHTPGPWGMETVRTSCGVCHKIGPWPHKWRAGATMSACIYDDYPSPPEGTDTMLANARLIAAAPDMLAALRSSECAVAELCHGQDPANQCWVILAEVRAAITKAAPSTRRDGPVLREGVGNV